MRWEAADRYIYKLNTNGYKQYKTDGEFIDVIKQCIINECTSWLNDLGIGIELGLSTVVEDGVEAWTEVITYDEWRREVQATCYRSSGTR